MILIVSRFNDEDANLVVNWLNFYQRKFIRITDKSRVKVLKVFQKKSEIAIILEVDGLVLDLKDVTFYFYRNAKIPFYWDYLTDKTEDVYIEISASLRLHFLAVEEIVEKRLEELPHLNIRRKSSPNKFLQLIEAAELGISVPETLVTYKKEDLEHFGERQVLTKTMGIPLFYQENKEFVQAFSSIVNSLELKERFVFSQFQSYVKKEFEIRAFYLDGHFYSVAIFSQKDNQTSIDFRRYNEVNPNRTVPFQLPSVLCEKLDQFMRKLELKTGSFDLIFSNGDFILLEVNPSGLFGMVSFPGNFCLEKRIAEYIINHETRIGEKN